ncbi:thioredoxin family protein [Flavobacterium sp. DGU11]|uniref:Thioredoxin family protein n=1 Tax=Flavobacterium arundinis TaxID=3139143 RepID=A0ABU9HW99_9FLAO
MKKYFLMCAFMCALNSIAQNVTVVDAASVKEIAKASSKKNTLFYTFGIWCEPCRLHLPTAIKLAKDHDLNFYVIIVDSEKSETTQKAVSFLKEQYKDIKIAVLSDAAYGEKTKKRNKKFVSEITPPQFEDIDDFSKYILLNQKGEVIMVTTWKDNRDNDWHDDSKMVQKRIVPLLKK